MTTTRRLRALSRRWAVEGQPLPSVAIYRRTGFFGRESWCVEVHPGLGGPSLRPANAVAGHSSAREALRAAERIDPALIRDHLRGPA